MRYFLLRVDGEKTLRRLAAAVVMTAAISAAAACAASVRTHGASTDENAARFSAVPLCSQTDTLPDSFVSNEPDTPLEPDASRETEEICFSHAEDEEAGGETAAPDVPAYICLERLELEGDIVPPLESAAVSSLFGYRLNPVTGKYTFHSGYDLAAPEGEKIRAMMDGSVSFAGWDSGYGNYIVIDHSGGVQTLYAHCSKLLCDKDDDISRGETIALVGATGGATGPHLHVEFRRNGQRYDPEWILGGIYA